MQAARAAPPPPRAEVSRSRPRRPAPAAAAGPGADRVEPEVLARDRLRLGGAAQLDQHQRAVVERDGTGRVVAVHRDPLGQGLEPQTPRAQRVPLGAGLQRQRQAHPEPGLGRDVAAGEHGPVATLGVEVAPAGGLEVAEHEVEVSARHLDTRVAAQPPRRAGEARRRAPGERRLVGAEHGSRSGLAGERGAEAQPAGEQGQAALQRDGHGPDLRVGGQPGDPARGHEQRHPGHHGERDDHGEEADEREPAPLQAALDLRDRCRDGVGHDGGAS